MLNLQHTEDRRKPSAFSIENVHNYEDFRQYNCQFSNNQHVNILIAFTKVGPGCIGTFALEGSTIIIRHVTNFSDWVKQIAVRKKMHQMKIGDYIDSSLLYQFDGVICIINQKMIGINVGQITVSLREWRQKQAKQKQNSNQYIKSHYKDILSDLHHHQIVFKQIKSRHLAVSPKHKSFVMLLRDQWDVYKKGELGKLNYKDQAEIIKLKQSNIDQIKTVLQNTELKQNEDQPNIQSINPEVSSFLQYVYVIHTLYFKEFSEFKRAYEIKSGQKFDGKYNKELSAALIRFYEATNQRHNKNELLRFQFQQHLSKLTTQWQCVIQLQRISLQQLSINSAHSTYQKHINTKIKYANKNPNEIQQPKTIIQKSKNEKNIQFGNKIKDIRTGNKIDKLRWHFEQAKVYWRQFQFYRALGHLKKCRKYQTQESMILSVIELEQGRNYQHLCLIQEAQTHYQKCITIREKILGTHSQHLIFPLHNLLHLYIKSGNKQKKLRTFQRLFELFKLKDKTAKQNNAACQSVKITSILFNQAANQGNSSAQLKSSEIYHPLSKISKQDLMKWQFQRFTSLNQFYNKAKQVIQKPEVQKKYSTVLKDLFKFGQLSILNSVVNLIYSLYQNKKFKLSDLQQKLTIKTIKVLQKTNTKMLHIFLFVMSYYWQMNNQYQKTISCIKRLLKYFVQKQTLVCSFLKRLLHIYKQAECFSQLLELYRSKQIDLDIHELYDCIIFLLKNQQYVLLIKYCNVYLKNIKQYSTIAEEDVKSNPPQNRIINCSQSVSYILAEAYFNCRDYESAWKIISQLPHSFLNLKLNIYNYWRIIVTFCLFCYKQKQVMFFLEGCNKLMTSIEGNEQKYYSNDKMVMLEQDLWVGIVDCLISHKISDFNLYFNWLKNRGNLVVKNIEKSKLGKLIEKISKQCLNTTLWQPLEQLMKVAIQSVNCELNQLQSHLYSDFGQNHSKLKTSILTSKAMDFDVVFKDTVALIKNSVQCQGRSSPLIISLHLVLLELTQKLTVQECQLLILFWMVSRPGLTIEKEEDNINTTVQGRQYRFDQLFYQYCMNKKDIRSSTSILHQLWWYQDHLITLQSLKAKFNKIITPIISQDQQQDHQSLISSFKIKYFSYFTSQLEDSSLTAALTQKQSQLQLQDEQI